jgi:hypothetical protein
MNELKNPMVKLTSVNCWVGETGICPCDENGNPIENELRLYDTLEAEWFTHLSSEDKELVNTIINKNK